MMVEKLPYRFSQSAAAVAVNDSHPRQLGHHCAVEVGIELLERLFDSSADQLELRRDLPLLAADLDPGAADRFVGHSDELESLRRALQPLAAYRNLCRLAVEPLDDTLP